MDSIVLLADKVKGIQGFLDGVLAVIVVYRCELSTVDSIVSLSRSLETSGCKMELMVYDNSPLSQEVPLSLNGISHIIYHHNPSNPGVAAAYNDGARIAGENGKKWLLLLDQDTSFPLSALEMYTKAVAANSKTYMFAPRLVSNGRLLSPCRYFGGMGYYLPKIESGLMNLKGRGVLNSGLLVNLQAFNEIGCFDERIPLDFADHDFCRRFSDRYSEIFILDLECNHSFSDSEKTSLVSALARFAFFCRGARFSTRSLSDRLTHPLVLLLRCGILSFRYRTWRFLHTMWLEI